MKSSPSGLESENWSAPFDRKLLARALKLEPTRASAYITLARLLPKGGAVGLYRRAISLAPSHHELHRELGGVLTELRPGGKALDADSESKLRDAVQGRSGFDLRL